MSINVWRLAGDTLNITCNFLYCKNTRHFYVELLGQEEEGGVEMVFDIHTGFRI